MSAWRKTSPNASNWPLSQRRAPWLNSLIWPTSPWAVARCFRRGGGTANRLTWASSAKGAAFARVHRRFGADVERAMVDRAGSDPSRTWMEYMALYCEIESIETTLMPHEFILAESHDGVLPGDVPIRLQSTAEILAKKLRHRLHGAGRGGG